MSEKESGMIKTEIISNNALKIVAPEKLQADDFRKLRRRLKTSSSNTEKSDC